MRHLEGRIVSRKKVMTCGLMVATILLLGCLRRLATCKRDAMDTTTFPLHRVK